MPTSTLRCTGWSHLLFLSPAVGKRQECVANGLQVMASVVQAIALSIVILDVLIRGRSLRPHIGSLRKDFGKSAGHSLRFTPVLHVACLLIDGEDPRWIHAASFCALTEDWSSREECHQYV